MADALFGDLNYTVATGGGVNKLHWLTTADDRISTAVDGLVEVDLASLSGTQVLTEVKSAYHSLDLTGSKSGTVTLEVDADIQKPMWIRDSTTDGNAVTFQPTGGAGIVLPVDRWIKVRVRAATVEHVAGWMDETEAGALSFAAAYQVVSGRALVLYKDGSEPAVAGGMVHLEGAVEETTSAPIVGDTIVTLPAGYRPKFTVAFIVVAEAETAANADPIAIEITTGGAVIILNLLTWAAATNAAIDLSGISFMAGN